MRLEHRMPPNKNDPKLQGCGQLLCNGGVDLYKTKCSRGFMHYSSVVYRSVSQYSIAKYLVYIVYHSGEIKAQYSIVEE